MEYDKNMQNAMMNATSVYSQLDQDRRQSYAAFQFNNQQVNVAPFDTDQGYGRNETRPLDFNHCMAPIVSQTQATTTETYNAANLNPRTYMGGNAAGSIPYGYARGQLSLFTNLQENKPGEILVMSNARVFQHVASEETPQYVKPSTLGGGT